MEKAALAADHGDVHTTALRELDERLQRLGDFAWEIGPGESQPNALVISPSGDYETLRTTRAIVSVAPAVSGWQFYPAKPARDWDYAFRLHGERATYNFDAKNWRYILAAHPDGTYDIDITSPELVDVPESTRQEALETVVEGAIGEELRIGYVGEIRCVPSFARGPGIALPMLSKQLPDLVRKAAAEDARA
jgi:hypothetical protein